MEDLKLTLTQAAELRCGLGYKSLGSRVPGMVHTYKQKYCAPILSGVRTHHASSDTSSNLCIIWRLALGSVWGFMIPETCAKICGVDLPRGRDQFRLLSATWKSCTKKGRVRLAP